MTPPVKGAGNVASKSRRLCRALHMVVFTRVRSDAPYRSTTPGPSLNPDPSQRAKTFAQTLARAYKTKWVGGYNPFSLFKLGVGVFHLLGRGGTGWEQRRAEWVDVAWLAMRVHVGRM